MRFGQRSVDRNRLSIRGNCRIHPASPLEQITLVIKRLGSIRVQVDHFAQQPDGGIEMPCRRQRKSNFDDRRTTPAACPLNSAIPRSNCLARQARSPQQSEGLGMIGLPPQHFPAQALASASRPAS